MRRPSPERGARSTEGPRARGDGVQGHSTITLRFCGRRPSAVITAIAVMTAHSVSVVSGDNRSFCQ